MYSADNSGMMPDFLPMLEDHLLRSSSHKKQNFIYEAALAAIIHICLRMILMFSIPGLLVMA